LTFYPPKKVAPLLIRVEQNFLQNSSQRESKKRNFVLISKSLEFSNRKKNFTEKLIFWHLENFANKHFSEKKSLGTSRRKRYTHF
jgi:hypothetical protein